jgi:hypothetical protein
MGDLMIDIGQDGVSLYPRVQAFYARHMHMLDGGMAAEWAEDFAENGVFLPPRGEPVVGRSAIRDAVVRSAKIHKELGEQHRHWHGMIDLSLKNDEIIVKCYALIIVTKIGGEATLKYHCVCTDKLEIVDGQLLVNERSVSRDDLQ